MPTNTLKVLVVDDEPTIADTLAVILKQSGFETHAAYCGEDAVRQAAKIEPDLMITDVLMPDKNGIDVANEVQRRVPRCRVLFFSGHSVTAALLLKVKRPEKQWEVLPKPVHPHDLLAKVDDVMDEDEAEAEAKANRRQAA
jgi:DNA-binding NtrC family response regulator